jgi:hypothetical protein
VLGGISCIMQRWGGIAPVWCLHLACWNEGVVPFWIERRFLSLKIQLRDVIWQNHFCAFGNMLWGLILMIRRHPMISRCLLSEHFGFCFTSQPAYLSLLAMEKRSVSGRICPVFHHNWHIATLCQTALLGLGAWCSVLPYASLFGSFERLLGQEISVLVRTSDTGYYGVNLWESEAAINAMRPPMISYLDQARS